MDGKNNQHSTLSGPAIAQQLRRAPPPAKAEVAALWNEAADAARRGGPAAAEALLRRLLSLEPGFASARASLADGLRRLHRYAEALAELDRLGPAERQACGGLETRILIQIGRHEEALRLYREMLARAPREARLWARYATALKATGAQAESIAAYRRALALAPGLADAWLGLADLKTPALGEADVAAIRAALAGAHPDSPDRAVLHFALGKALEDNGDPAAAFDQYREGNHLRRSAIPYDREAIDGHVRRSRTLLTPDFFAARAGYGHEANDPIFIVGLTRSGSTLIEQILASHPSVEGTTELPNIAMLLQGLGAQPELGAEGRAYPELLAELTAEQCRALGEAYLETTRIQRRTGRPLFIDKQPRNWLHLGFIRLILPNAKVIDARRHPLACGLSNYRQYFARSQAFAYDLADIGHYYRNYAELMTHFDALQPGRILRLIHERLVEEPEAEIRRLLDFLGLPFDPACLRFHETERAVRTASSEQVRRPLNRDGLDQWRDFEPWLGPLKAALGPVLDLYPEPPPLP